VPLIIGLLLLAFVVWFAVRLGRSAQHPEPSSSHPIAQPTAATHSTIREAIPTLPKLTADDCWIPPGRPTDVAGFRLLGGMLYVGSRLGSVSGYRSEPALIDPSLPVNGAVPDSRGTGMTYWPSYESISPECRAGYLEWLSAGRRGSDTYIGYVFLFLYGLERRILADSLVSTSVTQDLSAIRDELVELHRVYAENGSFRRYASQLLEVLDVVSGQELVPPMTKEPHSLGMPLPVRVGLGRIIADGKPIPPEWAARWYLTHPEISLRTPARRCLAEFLDLFGARYVGLFGEGLLVARGRTKLSLEIAPASASFGGPVSIHLDIPDVVPLRSPFAKLRAIGEACTDDLDAFSRWIGRYGDAPRTIAAVALLPPELAATHPSEEAQSVLNWAARSVDPTVPALRPADELLHLCPSFGQGSLSKNEATLLAQLFEKGGYGIEPDVRFGGPPVTSGGAVVLFSLPTSAAGAVPTPEYVATSLLLHLAVAVAASDGTISLSEEEHLRDRLEGALALTEHERLRLSAHLCWLKGSMPGLTGLRRRLEPLRPAQREAIADFIVGVAGADGHISSEEIQTLGKIYSTLGLAPDDVYGHVHAMAAGGASVAPGSMGGAAPGTPAPIPTRPVRGERAEVVRLDLELVQKKLAESVQIAEILEDVFGGGDLCAAPLDARRLLDPHAAPTASGRILARLVERSKWSRIDFERLACECDALPDGVIESLNEAAIERAGRPVIEGVDPLEVDLPTARELMQ